TMPPMKTLSAKNGVVVGAGGQPELLVAAFEFNRTVFHDQVFRIETKLWVRLAQVSFQTRHLESVSIDPSPALERDRKHMAPRPVAANPALLVCTLPEIYLPCEAAARPAST